MYNDDPSKNAHIQAVRNEEGVEMFTQHVEQCIITNKEEPRLLIGLLSDYNRFLENVNFEKCIYTSTVRKIIEDRFGDRIGFHMRFHKKQSLIAYDKSEGGTYIEAAMNAWGIDDVLVKNVASCLHKKVRTIYIYLY